jgi:hypothetical protein
LILIEWFSVKSDVTRQETLFILLDPPHDERNHKVDLRIRKLPPLLDTVPFLKAVSAACAGGMLCDEYRMVFHGGLLPIVLGKCRCKAASDKIDGVLPDGRRPFFLKV